MICPTCHQEIPILKRRKRSAVPLLGCPKCVEAKSYQGILKYQEQFLPRITTGDIPVTLTKRADETKFHIVFTGPYRQAWCGTKRFGQEKYMKRTRYPEIGPTHPLCDRCQEVLEQLAAEQTRPPVQTMEEIR